MYQDSEGHTHLSEVEASGGEKTGVMRYVLAVSLLLAIGVLSVMWIYGASTTTEPSNTNATGIAEEGRSPR